LAQLLLIECRIISERAIVWGFLSTQFVKEIEYEPILRILSPPLSSVVELLGSMGDRGKKVKEVVK
jgi:hypothetical protein